MLKFIAWLSSVYDFFSNALQLKEELARCERLKLQNIEQIIKATRKELIVWWDKCFVLSDVRAAFRPFYEGDCKMFGIKMAFNLNQMFLEY